MKGVALLAFLLVGCASSTESRQPVAIAESEFGLITEQDLVPITEADFASVNRCMSSWAKLVSEWVELGGSLHSSTSANVAAVLAGKDSALKRLLIESWRLQSIDPEAQEPGVAFIRASSDYVPEGCRSTPWLSAVLRRDLRAVSMDTVSEAMLVRNMPSDTDKRSIVDALVAEIIAKPERWIPE